MTPDEVTLTAQRLARLVERLQAPEPSVATIDRFYRCLDAVLQETPALQREVLHAAWNALAHDTEATQRLREEIELECELQYIQNDRHREKAVVLFALPLVCDAQSEPAWPQAQDLEALKELAQGLTESDVVHYSAQLALHPRLWTLPELEALTPGEVRLLTRCMGVQAVRGQLVYEPDALSPHPTASREDAARAAGPERFRVRKNDGHAAKRTKGARAAPLVQVAGANMQLYFVLGAACVGDELLEDIFPALPDEPTERALSPQEREPAEKGLLVHSPTLASPSRPAPADDLAWEHTPGQFEDGTPWEDYFYEQAAYAFGLPSPVLGTQTPNGYFEDLLSAQQLARKVGMLQLLEPYLPGPDDLEDSLAETFEDSVTESSEDNIGEGPVEAESDTADDEVAFSEEQLAAVAFRPYAARDGSSGIELSLTLSTGADGADDKSILIRWPVLWGESAPEALAELQELMRAMDWPDGTELQWADGEAGDGAEGWDRKTAEQPDNARFAAAQKEYFMHTPALPMLPPSLLLH